MKHLMKDLLEYFEWQFIIITGRMFKYYNILYGISTVISTVIVPRERAQLNYLTARNVC